MTQLKGDPSVRPASSEDIEAVHELFNEYWETLTGVTKFTLEDFQSIFSTPSFEFASSTLLVTAPEGTVVASGLVFDLGDLPIHPNFCGCVRKGYEGQGIGSHLLEWGEERARQAIVRCPESARVYMYVQAAQPHQPTVDLLTKSGLTPIRFSWFMSRDLEDAMPQPV